MVSVDVIYIAENQASFHKTLELQLGERVIDALNASGVYEDYPETKNMTVGIYAKAVELDRVLKEGDRVEIYRPLRLDPKEKRRLKAKKK